MTEPTRPETPREIELKRWRMLGFYGDDVQLTDSDHDFLVSLDMMRRLVPADGWIYLPGWRPAPEWTNSGAQGLVDCQPYTGSPGPDWRWCSLEHVDADDTAGVYPYKVQIPERGIGQYKDGEVRMWRIGHDTLAATGAEHARQGDRIGPFPP